MTMDWFGGPPDPHDPVFLGIQAYAVSRIAKIVQFFSGLAILIEIIGKEKIELISGRIKTVLNSIKTTDLAASFQPIRAQPLSWALNPKWVILSALGLTVWLMYILVDPVLFEFGLTILSVGWLLGIFLIALAMFIFGIFTAAILLYCVGTLIGFLFVNPFEKLLDSSCSIIVRSLEAQGLSHLILLVCLALFILGFVADLAVS